MNDEKKKKELFQEGLRQYKLMDFGQKKGYLSMILDGKKE